MNLREFAILAAKATLRIPPLLKASIALSKVTDNVVRCQKEKNLAKLVAPDGKVRYGVFSGMTYSFSDSDVCPPLLLPKLLGSYESELQPTLEKILDHADRYSDVINVGCADGYYAVGFAFRMKRIAVHAFDIDKKARKLCRMLAQQNDVSERVKIGEALSIEMLSMMSFDKRALLICDIEGSEHQLLDPQKAPNLVSMDILVEVHEFAHPNLKQELLSRFKESHLIDEIQCQLYPPSDVEERYPVLKTMPFELQRECLREDRRYRTDWLFLTSRS